MLKPIKYTTRESPDVNYGLWLIMICQYRFINCIRCTTRMKDVDSVGEAVHVKKQGAYENSELVAQVFCNLKTTLKIKFL